MKTLFLFAGIIFSAFCYAQNKNLREVEAEMEQLLITTGAVMPEGKYEFFGSPIEHAMLVEVREMKELKKHYIFKFINGDMAEGELYNKNTLCDGVIKMQNDSTGVYYWMDDYSIIFRFSGNIVVVKEHSHKLPAPGLNVYLGGTYHRK